MLVVTGAPASGKTTVATRLAHDLGLPYLGKDLFKETLFDVLGWSDRAWSQRVATASMRLLFRCAAAVLEAGGSVVLESNFYDAWDTPELLRLQQRFGCRFVQVVCTAPGPLLVERFEARVRSGDRHPGHVDPASLEELRPKLLDNVWGPLGLSGPVLRVDTHDFTAIDYAALSRSVRDANG